MSVAPQRPARSQRAAIAIVAATVALLAGCAPQPAPMPAAPVDAVSSPRLPRGYVRTDGHGDIAVSLAGAASCTRTTPAEAAASVAAANTARARRGLAPLVNDPRLQRAAEDHACEMARRGTMTHVGTATKGPSARVKKLGYRPAITSENIAAGRMDLGRVIAEWTGSPDHLSNIVIPGLRHHGIGHAVAVDGKSTFWAAVYAQPR